MRKKRVLVVTGTRAEYGLLHPVVKEIQASRSLVLRLLVTGMHTQKKYGHTIDEIKKHVPISCTVAVRDDASMLECLADEIKGISAYCEKEKPDIVLVSADRDEAFAAAIVAGHLGIPVAHLSGGDATGPVVDDLIRNAITKFSHVHFPLTKKSAQRLIKMGEEKWRIHPFGTTAFDDVDPKSLQSRTQLAQELHLDALKKWILFIQHPAALEGTPIEKQIRESLSALSQIDSETIVIYPNSDTGSKVFIAAIKAYKSSAVAMSYPRHTFLSLLKNVDVMVGNSSAGIVEAGFFHTPVVNIGNREFGREHGSNVLHVPYERKAIARAIHRALTPAFRKKARHHHPYGSNYVSKNIVRTLENLPINRKLMYKTL